MKFKIGQKVVAIMNCLDLFKIGDTFTVTGLHECPVQPGIQIGMADERFERICRYCGKSNGPEMVFGQQAFAPIQGSEQEENIELIEIIKLYC